MQYKTTITKQTITLLTVKLDIWKDIINNCKTKKPNQPNIENGLAKIWSINRTETQSLRYQLVLEMTHKNETRLPLVELSETGSQER
jgi:hypothetical protein